VTPHPRARTLGLTPAAVAAVLLAVTAVGCAGQERGAFEPRSAEARAVNTVFWLMVSLGSLVFVAVVTLLVLARRGRRPDDDAATLHERSGRLVIGGGIVLPVVILVPLTVVMLAVGSAISPTRDATFDIRVTGHQFWWEIEYPDGTVTANEIHIPADRRVRIELRTADVIHSFWVPQLGGKIDMIPGETTELLIEADEPGRYIGQCTEFCGVQHARMRFVAIVRPAEEFDAWLAAESSDAAPPQGVAAERGASTFTEVGCASCHTVRGTDADGRLGPDLTHIASRSTLGAATVDNDRGHLAGWISDPQGIKPGSLMPPTPLTSQQLLDLLAYLEGLE
jgi:cytochrome c oxidase subunit II